MTVNKRKKGLIIAVVALVALIGVFGYIYLQNAKQPVQGMKQVMLSVYHGDGKEATHTVNTQAQYLGEALTTAGLIEGEQGSYGLYVKTVDGETADDSQQQWWCLTKGGEEHMSGVDATVIEDGESYELTLKTGW